MRCQVQTNWAVEKASLRCWELIQFALARDQLVTLNALLIATNAFTCYKSKKVHVRTVAYFLLLDGYQFLALRGYLLVPLASRVESKEKVPRLRIKWACFLEHSRKKATFAMLLMGCGQQTASGCLLFAAHNAAFTSFVRVV